MLRRLFTYLLFATLMLGLAGQGVAQASVPTDASTARPSVECMKMMMAGDSDDDTGLKDCRYLDCLITMAGCPSMIAPNAFPAIESYLYLRAALRVAAIASALKGWATAPATSPPKILI